MSFYQLAFLYLKRKKGKTILLTLVLTFISSMILSTNMILRASEDSKQAIQEQTSSKIVAEILKEENKISKKDISKINQIANVVSVNRHAQNTAYPVNFDFITNSHSTEEENLKVSLMSYDNLEKDSAFSEGTYYLTSGTSISKKDCPGIVINTILANKNGLSIGDELQFAASDQTTLAIKIIGLFTSGTERKQTDSIAAVNRTENQIFIDNASYSKLFGNSGYNLVSVYTKNPNQLLSLKTQLKQVLNGKAELTTSDALYEQMEAPLKQITRITSLIRFLTIITGFVIISLLLGMWMRTRQKETAIFISLGKSKKGIFMQVLLETILVFAVSVLAACAFGPAMTKLLQSLLVSDESTNMMQKVLLSTRDIVSLLLIGGVVVTIAVICSLLPIIKANPRDTLSRMEG